ncbi:unnamed protein product [Candidula unifasciata]|uniref:Putative Dachshund-homology domain-containing protein n=1 Tax=Candidula unifasciata TaxID=100452 RepID=A0A8S3YRV8_9EUPU|nr:unnamed protein product [Candidula unifasciata]
MGRTTSNGLTSADRSADFSRDLMAPQKAWNLETLLPCNFETATDSFPEIQWDDYLLMEFQEFNSGGVQKGLCEKTQIEAGSAIEKKSEFFNLHSVVISNKKIGAGDKESQTLTLKDMLVGDFHKNTTLSDANLLDDKVTDTFVADLITHDHSYADLQYKPQDMCSDNFMFGKTEDCSNQSATCSNPKLGIDEQVLDSCTEFSKNYIGFKPLSPASSTSSLIADLASSSSYSILSGDESDDMLTMTSSPLPSSDQAFTSTPSTLFLSLKQFKSRSPLPPSDQAFTSTPSSLSQNHKQFKARTPRQFNSQEQHRFLNFRSSMNKKQPSKELAADSYLKNCSVNSKEIATDSYLTNCSLKSKKHATDSHLTDYTINSDGVLPVFSPSSFDWDGPETMSETPYDISDTEVPVKFSNHASNGANLLQGVLHDHDYCSKVRFDSGSKKLAPLNPTVNTGMFKNGKRTYTKRSKINGMTEKILKAKYLKKELLKRDSSLKPVLNHKPKLTGPILTKPSSKPVGRQRKKVFNKLSEEDINPETEKKLKITGKFQDQYVYYLSKSSRTSSRGRQKSSLNSDKNLASVPKPEDIVIPHLTDADIEAVRLKGRDALKQPARQPSVGASPPSVPFQSACFSDNSAEHLYDVDSHIVSTILSMESDSVSYPVSQAPVISTSALNLSQSPIIGTSILNPSLLSVTSTPSLNLNQPSITSASSVNFNQSADISTSNLNLDQSADITSTSNLNLNQSADITSSSVNLNQPSVISTSSLNPNQPALTESLRLMSGDPTITSEHVLNYLLTLVKDNGFTDSAYGAESGTAVFFPPSVSDSITMADQAERTEGMLYEDTNIEYVSSGEEFLHMMNSVEISSSDEVLHHGVHNNANHCFQPPHSDCVTDRTLLDDLSSILESKEVFPSGNLHGDCSSSVKKTFKPDPCSERTTQASSSVDKLRSIEKTIDYLYKDDVFDHTQAESSLVTTPVPDDTPWIVTVTLYFNDVPAIMINNQPYIRLVDIYKQILPAKDTGILKKRCQLMNIPILSCTEMQRYFLVQYGKACNSKSTIIVSKDHAADLITYYTTPQSRAGRISQDHKFQPGSGLFHKTARNSSDERGSKKMSSQRLSVSKGHRKRPHVFENTFDISEVSSVSYGKQIMHKNSNCLDILKGQRKDNTSDSTNASLLESVVKTASSQTCNEPSIKPHRNTKMKQYSKGDVSRICSYIHHQKNRKKRHVHKVGKKHRTNDVNSEIDTKLPKVFLEVDQRSSLGLPQSDTETVKYKVKSKKCTHKKGSHHKKDLSSSATSAAPGRPLPSLPVKHQSVLSENGVEPQLPPQTANLYVDLFVRPESECVRCATCSQHLSVSHFMRHHHVPSDSGLLAAEATPRILVPLNSMDKMSKQEQHLWRKFQRLQKSVGSSNGVDDGTYSEYRNQNICILPKSSSSSLLHLDQPLQFTDHKRKRKLSSQLSSSSCHVECDENPDSLAKRHKFSPTSTPSASSSHKHSSEAISDLVTRDYTQTHQLSEVPAGAKIYSLRDGRLTEGNALSPRTSARKRISKQLFSIEDY